MQHEETQVLVEKSATGACWRMRQADERAIAALVQRLGMPEVLARFLVARGVSLDDAPEFLNPSLRACLPDPSHLKDMDIAAKRLCMAIKAGERIAVFGDYDVDGATSSALLLRFFRSVGSQALVYIPDRITEGYGPNTPALLKLKEQGVRVVITVDCGTLSFEPLAAAHEAGLEVIVVDHHAGEAQLPKAVAVINPNRVDESSPHRHLAAVGVAFLLAVAVARELRTTGWFADRPQPDLMQLLDLVALGTVCDVVPLTGVNRALVSQGLKVMASRSNLGIRTLMDVARLDEKPEVYHAGFVLGPRVNAGGRVGKADFGARLLATENEMEARELAIALDQYNNERKAIEAGVLEQAMIQAEAQIDAPVIVVASNGWHPGVIGIVAGRIKERFHRPVAVLALADGLGKASARSVPGFDFGAAVIAARQQQLLVAGGGHAMAAGFTVEEGKIAQLQSFFAQRMGAAPAEKERTFWIDTPVFVTGLSAALAEAMAKAGPFGAGHPAARFYIPEAKVVQVDIAGQDHVKAIICDPKGAPGRAVAFAFRAAGSPLGQAILNARGRTLKLVCEVRLKEWMGSPQAGITILDAA